MILATVANMREYQHVRGMVMYSPTTGERYSADAGDYWNAPESTVFKDAEGNDMILVYEYSTLVDVDLNVEVVETPKPATDEEIERSFDAYR